MTAIDNLLQKRGLQTQSSNTSSGSTPIDKLMLSTQNGTYGEYRNKVLGTNKVYNEADYKGIHANFRPGANQEPKEQKGLFGNTWEIMKDPERSVIGELGKVKLGNVWNSIKQKSKQIPASLQSGLVTGLEEIEDVSFGKSKNPVYTAINLSNPYWYANMLIEFNNKKNNKNMRQIGTNIMDNPAQRVREVTFEKNRQLEDIYQKTRPASEGLQRNIEDVAGSLPSTGASLGVGIAGSVLGSPAVGLSLGFSTSYAMSADEVYTEARMYGLNDEEASNYAKIAAPIVASIDLLPLDELTAGASNKPVKATIQRYILREMQKTGNQALLEGGTEAMQEVVQNAVASMYNENKSLLEGVPESILVGSIIGGVSNVTMEGAQTGFDRATTKTGTPQEETYKYLQKVNENLDQIINTDPKKRTPQEQQIVDDLFTIEITPEMAMAYIVENDLGNSKQGQAVTKQALRAMNMNRDFRANLERELNRSMPQQSNVMTADALRLNDRFATELNAQLSQPLSRREKQQQYLRDELNAGLNFDQMGQTNRLNQGFKNELGANIDQMYQYPLSGETGGMNVRRQPQRRQKAIQIKPNERTGQIEVEAVDSRESIAEMMQLVREAVSAGDTGAARAIYNDITGKKPSFKQIVDDVNYVKQTEENRQKAETNKVIREQFGDEAISKINRLKTMARGKDAKAGDIETLRSKNSELTESVIESVREVSQYQNMTDEEALQVALTLPVQADTRAKRVEKASAVVEEEYKTEYDTPEIVEARKKANQIEETLNINTPERIQLREELTDKYYGEGAKNQNKRIDLVLGAPASGKSSRLVEPLAEEHGSLIIDSDMIKEELPEFNNGIGAGAVHQESSVIADKMIFKKAIANGDNIVFPRLGKKLKTMQELIDELTDEGYDIHIHFMDLPVHESAKRSVSRFKETGRFVDPDYIVNVVANKPATVYDDIKTYKGVQTYEKYTNDVPFGEKPVLLEKGRNKQTESRDRVGDQRQQRTERTERTERRTETKGKEVDLLAGVEDDIDYDSAYRAYYNISFYPERRAKSTIEDYVSQIKEDFEYLNKQVKDQEDKDILNDKFAKYRAGYKDRYLKYLNAKSRTMSSMITGPANFPTRRNQSRLNIEQGHLDELMKFRDKMLRRIKNDMNPTQIRGVGNKQLEQLETKLNTLKERHQMMKDVNKIIRSKKDVKNRIIERTGLKESTVDEIMKPDFAGRVGFPTFELSGNNANIKRLEGRVAEMKKKVANLDKEPIEHEFTDLTINGNKYEGLNGTAIKNYAEDRYQFIFDDKPDSKIRRELKSRGFRWSPSQGAWQRQISNNADYTMRQYFGINFKELEASQNVETVEDLPEMKITQVDETDTVAPEVKEESIEVEKIVEEPVEIEKIVEKPAQQKPVGTGEKRKSRAYKRVRDLLEADAQLSNVDYNALNLEQDAQNAIDYIARDQDSAMQVALGLKQPPRGQTETAISIALADKLRMEGDHVTASKLEASRSLRQTRRGQEIVSERGRFNDDSPYRYVQELVNRRLYELGGKVSKAKETVSRNNKGVKQDAVNQIDTEAQAIKEILLKKQSKMEKIRQAQKIIDDLKC